MISKAEAGEVQPQPRKAGRLQQLEEARNKSSPKVYGGRELVLPTPHFWPSDIISDFRILHCETQYISEI